MVNYIIISNLLVLNAIISRAFVTYTYEQTALYGSRVRGKESRYVIQHS